LKRTEVCVVVVLVNVVVVMLVVEVVVVMLVVVVEIVDVVVPHTHSPPKASFQASYRALSSSERQPAATAPVLDLVSSKDTAREIIAATRQTAKSHLDARIMWVSSA
jgi:hypothetical protein